MSASSFSRFFIRAREEYSIFSISFSGGKFLASESLSSSIYTKWYPYLVKIGFEKLKLHHKNVIFIHNKKDKAIKQSKKGIIYTSCKNVFGINALLTSLSTKVLESRDSFYFDKTFLLNVRQKDSLESYLKNLKVALRSFNETEDPSIFVNCLYKALDSLASTTKPIEKKALLNRVFKDFCVGK